MIREQSARQAYELAQARYQGGAVDFVAVLDSQRSYLQARFDVVGALNSSRSIARWATHPGSSAQQKRIERIRTALNRSVLVVGKVF